MPFSVDAPPVRLLQLVTDPGLHQAVLCGHGEQIGLLLGQLADGGLPIEPRCWPKGSTWVLVPWQATFALLPASRAAPPRRQARRYRISIAPTLWASRLATT